MKSFFDVLKKMTTLSLALFLAVPTFNVVNAEEETEIPEVSEETVIEETAEEVIEDEAAPEEETAEPEEIISEEAEEEAEPAESEEVVTEEEIPAEEATEETVAPEEEIPEEKEAEETVVPEEETAEPEEEKASEKGEKAENIDPNAAVINGTISDNAEPIELGVETDVNITTGGETKYFSFIPETSGVYFFKAIKDTNYTDSCGYLYNSSENQLTYDDQSGGDNAFAFIYRLEAGEQYYFAAKLYFSSETGWFTVILEQVSDGWFTFNNYTYYVVNGDLVKDLITEIDGELYKFDYEGRLVTNSSAEYNGKTYIIDENGHFVEVQEGWNQEGNYWFYVKDGEMVKNTVIRIGNSLYGFDYNGKMYSDTSFSESAYDADGNYLGYFGYRAKESGALYENQWYEELLYNGSSNWYYYGAEGRGAKNITKINGKDYLFNNYGKMLVHETNVIDGVTYIGDDNGYPVKVNFDVADGWLKVGSAWFYIRNKEFVTNEVLKIGGKYYGFDYSGKMYADQEFSIYQYNEGGHYVYYRAQSNGVLYTNAWCRDQYGYYWYYYGADAARVSGVQVIGGKTYVFNYWGEMLTNTTYIDGDKSYIIDDNGVATLLKEGWNKSGGYWYYVSGGNVVSYEVRKIGNDYYGFDSIGRMYDNESFNYNGAYYRAKSGGALYVNSWYGNYYYGAEGKGYRGAQKVNGVQYFFYYNAEAISNRYVTYNDQLYYTNDKCAATLVTNAGLYEDVINGSTGTSDGIGVYVENGTILKNSWKQINGKWYYFSNSGSYYIGIRSIGGTYYCFNINGTMVSNGWFKSFDGRTVYAEASGALKTGTQTISGKEYYFDTMGVMVTGVRETVDSVKLYANDGHLIGDLQNGWTQIKGTWYYYDGGEAYCDGVYTIDGSKYYFDGNYKMMVDCVNDEYVIGSNGKIITSGWYQIGAKWYYVNPATQRCYENQIVTISGKRYAFDYSGAMRVTSFVQDRVSYTVNASGVITAEKVLKEGWELSGGEYYYYKNGQPYNGWLGDYYIEYGRMSRDRIIDGYYVGNDGKYIKTAGWVDSYRSMYVYGGGQYYAKAGGKLVEKGWEKIDGSWYYFSSYRPVVYPIKLDDGKVYYFDYDGKLVKTVDNPAGDQWVNCGSYWGYIKNGEPVSGGMYTINGKKYSFSRGAMMTDTLSYYYNSNGEMVYYIQSDGTAASYSGWKKLYGRWYYFCQSTGAYINGWFNENGKTYYLGDDGMLTGWNIIRGRLYNFDSNGVLIGEETTENGWVQKGSDWYYFVNGSPLTNSVKLISGKVYGFTYEGKLGKNDLIHSNSVYFAGADGVIVKNTWKKVYGAWYYFGADGAALSGIQNINGTVYYFNGFELY